MTHFLCYSVFCFLSVGSVCWRFGLQIENISNSISDVTDMNSCQSLCESQDQCDIWQYDFLDETCGFKMGNQVGNVSMAASKVIGLEGCLPSYPNCKLDVSNLE